MAASIFFPFNIFIFIYFFRYEAIETHARSFLRLTILVIAGMWCLLLCQHSFRIYIVSTYLLTDILSLIEVLIEAICYVDYYLLVITMWA